MYDTDVVFLDLEMLHIEFTILFIQSVRAAFRKSPERHKHSKKLSCLCDCNLFTRRLRLLSHGTGTLLCTIVPQQRPFNYKGWSFKGLKAINSTARTERYLPSYHMHRRMYRAICMHPLHYVHIKCRRTNNVVILDNIIHFIYKGKGLTS